MEARTEQRDATLSAKVLDSGGNVIRDLGVISETPPPKQYPLGLIVLLIVVALAIGFSTAWLWSFFFSLGLLIFGLVTNVGVAFEAATFAGGTSTSAFNFHDSGTGTSPASVTDTALQTPTGTARVAGAQSTPGSANVYQTVATITYGGTFAVTEWGLFSASTSGTLWDHRIFSAINVVSGNSIQFTYSLTIPSGGS
jgi:energy-coupling factor transporter transmembrane protein EcfT